MQSLKNYYDILQIPQNASSTDIEHAYQKLSAFWHPDKHRDNRRNAEINFNDISEAYETLSNRNRRSNYDDLLSKQYSIDDASKTFQRFYEQFGVQEEHEKNFFDQHYPQRKRNFYDVLEVPRNASFDQIKQSYRRLAMKYHPKNNPGNEEANQRFIQINQAFNSLSNQSSRENYDDLIFERTIAPVKAHSIFENFWQKRPFDIPTEQSFFKPILKKKWSNTLDRLQNEGNWNNVQNGETIKTSTVQTIENGVETKKTTTTKRTFDNGLPVTTTIQEYDFPNGTKEVRKIKDDGRGNISTDVYNLNKGDRLPIGF